MAAALASIHRARPLLGTFVDIAATGEDDSEVEVAVDAAFDAVAKVHRLMSFHERDSDLARVNRQASSAPVAVDPWTFQVLDLALELHRRSNGAFDIAVAPVLQGLGLLPASSGEPVAPSQAGRSDTIELLAGHRVRFRTGTAIDLGGIAKGFAVDRAVEALKHHGALGGLVNAGGDLAAFGPERHRIHVRDPRDPQTLICEVLISNEALASSGCRPNPMGLQDAAGCAVIDPSSRTAVSRISGVAIIAPSCVVADALTKVAMVGGTAAGDLLETYQARALIALPSGEVHVTTNWIGVEAVAP